MRQIKFPVLILLMIFGLFSCQKDEMTLESENKTDINGDVEPKGMMVLGNKLENPYSVENMKKAYESLKSSTTLKSATTDTFEVVANTLYIRFLPKDSTDLRILWADTTIELFDFPLDYEIVEEGFYYHDPEIPEGQPTWQYTSVPIDYQFPNVKYEIIEECYIPEDDEEDIELKSSYSDDFYGQLELEAFRITGNLEEESTLKSTNGIMAKKKKPKGTIRVNNTIDGLEGVMRVKVRVHNFVKWNTRNTDESGNYQMDKNFRTNVHYAVIFENSRGFKIWGNWAFLAPAHYNMGWHSNSGYSRDIYQNSDAWKWSTVNNSVYKYIDYCDDFSISKPPSNLRVWVFEKGSGTTMGSASMLRRTWGLYGFTTSSKLGNFFLKMNGINLSVNYLALITKFAQPDITISVNSDNVGTDDVYNTTFHECAHASHWTKVGSSYWVKYINYIITYGAYGDGTGQNAGYCGVGEMWGNYIGAMLERQEFSRTNWNDLNHGEDWYNPGFLRHVDDIPDVTTSEIFSCMTSNTNTIAKMVEQLKTKTENDEDVDNAYDLYPDWP